MDQLRVFLHGHIFEAVRGFPDVQKDNPLKQQSVRPDGKCIPDNHEE